MKKLLFTAMTFVMLSTFCQAQEERACSEIPLICDEISDWSQKSRRTNETYKMYRFLNEALLKYDTLLQMSDRCNCELLFDLAQAGKDICQEGLDSKDWSVTRAEAQKSEDHASNIKRLIKKCPSKNEEEDY